MSSLPLYFPSDFSLDRALLCARLIDQAYGQYRQWLAQRQPHRPEDFHWTPPDMPGWRFSAPVALLKYIAKKGSICVDGVSLTVNEVDDEGFEVALIPHTVAHTAFAATGLGDAVNLEIDLVARYVERLLGARTAGEVA